MTESRQVPRWMRLAMPDDVAQIIAMVEWQYHTPGQRRIALRYELRRLRREVWERKPTRPIKRPAALRPSRHATGYRTNSAAHREARLTLTPEHRRAIARKGQACLRERIKSAV